MGTRARGEKGGGGRPAGVACVAERHGRVDQALAAPRGQHQLTECMVQLELRHTPPPDKVSVAL